MRLIADRLGAIWKACASALRNDQNTQQRHMQRSVRSIRTLKMLESGVRFRGSTLRRVRGFVGDVYERDRISSKSARCVERLERGGPRLPSRCNPGSGALAGALKALDGEHRRVQLAIALIRAEGALIRKQPEFGELS